MPKAGTIKILSRAHDEKINYCQLTETLEYDPLTGMFTWKKLSKYKPFLIGTPAGYRDQNTGYIFIKLGDFLFRAHRLAWFYVYKEWPSKLVDHINGNGSDNRICNLRLASDVQNKRNQKLRSNSKSGFKGVSFDSRRNKYRARIKANREIWLGYFDTALEAHNAYRNAAIKFHGKFARLK